MRHRVMLACCMRLSSRCMLPRHRSGHTCLAPVFSPSLAIQAAGMNVAVLRPHDSELAAYDPRHAIVPVHSARDATRPNGDDAATPRTDAVPPASLDNAALAALALQSCASSWSHAGSGCRRATDSYDDSQPSDDSYDTSNGDSVDGRDGDSVDGPDSHNGSLSPDDRTAHYDATRRCSMTRAEANDATALGLLPLCLALLQPAVTIDVADPDWQATTAGAALVRVTNVQGRAELDDGFLDFSTMPLARRCVRTTDLSALAGTGVTRVGRGFLRGAFSLARIDLTALESVQTLGAGFLQDARRLHDVSLAPLRNVEAVPDQFLAGCSRLTLVDLRSARRLARIGHCFALGCTRLKRVMLPRTLRCVESHFCYGCYSLVRVGGLERLQQRDGCEVARQGRFGECHRFRTAAAMDDEDRVVRPRPGDKRRRDVAAKGSK